MLVDALELDDWGKELELDEIDSSIAPASASAAAKLTRNRPFFVAFVRS